MDLRPESDRPSSDARLAVGRGIQNLMAARLGRAFIPLTFLFGWGAVILQRGGAAWVVLGALITSATMMAHGLRTVQLALGRPRRAWMTATVGAALVPPIYGVFVLGWKGFRSLATASDWGSLLPAILFVVLGGWVLYCWMKIVEIDRLARTMTLNLDDGGGSP